MNGGPFIISFRFFEFVIWIGLRIQLQRCFVPNNKNSCWYLLLFGTKHLWPPPVSSQIIIHSSSSKGVSSQTIINSCWYLLLFGTKHLWRRRNSLLFGTKHLWLRKRTHRAKKPSSTNECVPCLANSVQRVNANAAVAAAAEHLRRLRRPFHEAHA